VEGIRAALAGMGGAEGIDTLRGHEGVAGRYYFSGLPGLLREDLDARLHFSGRNRRPPKDCFNALLSFGYGLLYRDVMQAILAVGLEPTFGFFHQPRSAAHPLALDLMELFRVPLWDMSLIASVNRLQWDPDADFTYAGSQVWLSHAGRKKVIEVYERRKEDQWKHPVTRYSLSYARLIELEVRLLEKEWTGEPGLFARMRLR
jgi:CRISPR-associated protein Cas1